MATQEPKGRSFALPSNNPLPLSATQEQQVRELYYKKVRAYCADDIRAFAECFNSHSLTVGWACRQLKLAMNNCMLAHINHEEEDRAREQWFASAPQRRADREAKERRMEDNKKYHREWWGIDERGQLIERK